MSQHTATDSTTYHNRDSAADLNDQSLRVFRSGACMARKKKAEPTDPDSPPKAFEETLGATGSVIKGVAITQVEAETRRKAGLDVVVCGPN